MSIAASGNSYEIVHGAHRALICEVGATLRGYWVDEVAVTTTFEADTIPVGCQGQHLLPWPNRIRDGRYFFDREYHQLAINEPERNNALHGLASWVPWQLLDHTPTIVSQRVVVHAQPGWPGTVEAIITHRVDADGLRVEVQAHNVGSSPVPFGYAAHPYLVCGERPIDAWTMTIPFSAELQVEPERLLPVRLGELTRPDLRDGAVIGDTRFDTAFTSPERGVDEAWSVWLTNGERSVELWAGPGLDWLQVYTPDDRASVAVEPMSCGPDAFNPGPTHGDVVVLEPGDAWAGSWGVRAGA